jgi:5-methylcytosine-specific restriction endonuclease McrA
MGSLHKDIVLVLNRNWQAIGVKTPAETIGMLMTDAATALNIEDNDVMIPVRWKDWVNLPITDNDLVINTVSRSFKIPKVIVLCKFDKVPKKRPAFSSKNIWIREKGKCAYTGKRLKPDEGNIDHLIPKSRGGKTDWTNCVLAHKDVNAKKANKTPEEAGLKLLIKPEAPKELPVYFFIKNRYNIREWNYFLKHENQNDN